MAWLDKFIDSFGMRNLLLLAAGGAAALGMLAGLASSVDGNPPLGTLAGGLLVLAGLGLLAAAIVHVGDRSLEAEEPEEPARETPAEAPPQQEDAP